MIVSPEISTRTAVEVPIASNVTAPVIAKRSADTVVVTPDGMPVIIGGLMENTKTDTTQKVPILGDIPILGYAFKRTIKKDVKKELIIVLTPHIVRTATQMAELSTREGKQSKLTSEVWSQDELDRYIDTLPVKSNGSTSPIQSTKPSKKKKGGATSESRSKVD